MDKVMYHDWRLVPKHQEEEFTRFVPVADSAPRFVPYPPLLRAMILAERRKENQPLDKEPAIDLQKTVPLKKDFFLRLQEEQQSMGTLV